MTEFSNPSCGSIGKCIAFYLPQFHRTLENDNWWGDGFTEWTMVRGAMPLFPGHRQPRRPGTLGYYDLRDPDVRKVQAELAEQAGVAAFAYWHYWFAGKRLLNDPIDAVLASGEPGFPFCLAWANESWTRVWSGQPRKVLIEQTYPGYADFEEHFRLLDRFFADERYVRVDNRPLFIIYRPHRVPDLDGFLQKWAQWRAKQKQERPFVVGQVDSSSRRGLGDWTKALDGVTDVSWTRPLGRLLPLRKRLPRRRPVRVEYRELARQLSLSGSEEGILRFPVVLSGWDSTPRHGLRGIVACCYDPAALQHATEEVALYCEKLPADRRLVFAKSWNEWSEGNYLEPDEDYGHMWLDALATGLGGRAPAN